MGRLTGTELRRARAEAQLLRPARRTPEQIVRRLLVVQAQDHRHARIALWTRSTSVTQAAIDRALTERVLVIAWLNRGTLHLVCAEDYWWLLALTAPTQTTSNETRLRQLGVTDPARAARAIERLLEDGPMEQSALRDAIGPGFVPHTLAYSALRGRIVRCGQYRWVLTADWLGRPPAVDRDAALAELGRRYVRAHAPCEPEDLAAWAGLPLRDARRALAGVPQRPRSGDEPIPPRLLPAWDEYLLGWKDRSFLVDDNRSGALYRGGLIGPAATIDGRAVGKWRIRKGEPAKVERFAGIDAADLTTLNAEAAALGAFYA